MAPIAARQSELCGESREITIHWTVCMRVCVCIYMYTVYTCLCACVCACAGFYIVCLCVSMLYGDTDDDGWWSVIARLMY